MSYFKNMVAGCVVCVFGFCGSAGAVTLTWDFESGDLSDTTSTNTFQIISGTAFDFNVNGTPSQPVLYSATDGSNAFGGGSYFIRTDYETDGITTSKPGDDAVGVIESSAFLLGVGSMLSMEGAGDGGNVEVVRNSDSVVLATITPGLQDTALAQYSSNLAAFSGTSVFLRVSDTSSGGWGHIAVDNLAVTNATLLPTPTAPEPSTLLLTVLSMVGLAVRRSRRKRS